MELTTKNIIKILPFEESFKSDLIIKFDTMDLDRRLTIERIVWDLYDALFALQLEENIRNAISEQGSGVNLDDQFYKTIKEQTEKQMQSSASASFTKVDLDVTRDKLQHVISEKVPSPSA